MNDQFRRRSVGPPAARSMLLTVLGEYVLPARGGVWQETLISALGSLQYKTQAARQALARSVGAGWLRTERHGRRARMYLTEDTREMLTSGAERIYGFGAPREWDGRWLLVLVRVPEERRDVRHLIRSQLAWAGFGSLGNGLWITPHVDREAEVTRIVRDLDVAELLSFRAEFGAIGDPAKVVADAWELDDVASRYREFVSRFGRLRVKTPETAFRAQTELVHTWRKFPFLDPDLPQAMLPSGWPRSRAHQVFEERHAEWQAPAQEYFGSLERLFPAPPSAPAGRVEPAQR
jgi:phenylacetic acid degradation operon negative regulatory protein